MIKLPQISSELLTEFYNDQKKQYRILLENNKNNPAYQIIINYLSTNGKLDDTKIKDIIIGDRQHLENAINSIGIIPKRKNQMGDPVYDFTRLYENFTGRKLGQALADKIGVTVCPYCNRSYVFTVRGKNVRPQYDHFFEKSKYPYLAVANSFYGHFGIRGKRHKKKRMSGGNLIRFLITIEIYDVERTRCLLCRLYLSAVLCP